MYIIRFKKKCVKYKSHFIIVLTDDNIVYILYTLWILRELQKTNNLFKHTDNYDFHLQGIRETFKCYVTCRKLSIRQRFFFNHNA